MGTALIQHICDITNIHYSKCCGAACFWRQCKLCSATLRATASCVCVHKCCSTRNHTATSGVTREFDGDKFTVQTTRWPAGICDCVRVGVCDSVIVCICVCVCPCGCRCVCKDLSPRPSVES